MQEINKSSDGVPKSEETKKEMVEVGDNKIEVPPMTNNLQSEQPLSKTQMKKRARLQRMLDCRKERRKIEKEKKKSKRRVLAKLRQENGDNDQKDLATTTKRTKLMSESDNKFKVVIDMDFEDFMTDPEIGKSAKQVGRIYALNRRSDRPCQLYLTSLKGKIRDRFAVTNAGYSSWDMNISEDDYLNVFASNNANQLENERDNIIYLTADTDNTLPNVEDLLKDESKIFIIGGLVDHNRHKKLCYERALERNIKTAKLPIKDYVQLCQRHILSTVTVFEILLNVLASKMSWRDAFIASIPKRKLAPEVKIECVKSEEITIEDNKLPNVNEHT